MKRDFLERLAEAAYNARREQLLTGAYPNSAAHVPDSMHFYQWDKMDHVPIEHAVKSLYRKEAEAVLGAFMFSVMTSGNAPAKQALDTLLCELGEAMFTDLELALIETEREQIIRRPAEEEASRFSLHLVNSAGKREAGALGGTIDQVLEELRSNLQHLKTLPAGAKIEIGYDGEH